MLAGALYESLKKVETKTDEFSRLLNISRVVGLHRRNMLMNCKN